MDKKYLINHCIYLFTTLIAAVLIGYVVFHLSGSGETNLSTAIAKRISSGQTITEKGYIFKDESPLYVSGTGSVYSDLKEGAKVASGAKTAKVYDDPDGLIDVLIEYDKAIDLLESANAKESSKKIETELQELTARLRREAEEGNVAAAQRKTEQLQVLLNLRKIATGTKDNYAAEIAQLKKAKEEIEAELGKEQQTILAPFAGNYYSTCDGYEPLFTKEAAENLTISSFSELTASAKKQETPEGSVAAGKLLKSSSWYLALLTESGSAPEMVIGQSYTLTFSGKGSFEMTLEKMQTDQESGKTLLVFKSDLVPAAGLLERSEQVSLEVAKVTGLMVPTAAVRYLPSDDPAIPDQTGVYVKVGNKLLFKRIRILCESNGYYVAKELPENDENVKKYLALNDVIVTSGKELEEGYRN